MSQGVWILILGVPVSGERLGQKPSFLHQEKSSAEVGLTATGIPQLPSVQYGFTLSDLSEYEKPISD
ncbi:hypothetical protein TNCV_2981181 [Trichonephila clavipes]|nr:hypothetical protein TNCV_2981181 [Trichonephila clavipes]